MYKVYELSIQCVYKSIILQGFQLSFTNTNDYFINQRMLNILYTYYLILHLSYVFFLSPYILIFINYFNNNL